MTDITRFRGDTYPDRLTFTDTNGDPVDLTGGVVYLTVNRDKNPTDDSNQVFQLTGVLVDAANGVADFAPDVTQADNTGKWNYDVQFVDGGGVIRTLVKAKYTIVEDISKNES